MDRSQVRVGILGFGVVGQGTYHALTTNAPQITRRTGAPIVVAGIADIDWERPRDVQAPPVLRTTDARALIADPSIGIIVETIGGVSPALDFVLAAIEAGKSVVTSNKEMMARHGEEILRRAAERGVDVQFEGAVGGAIPIIRALKESLAANRIFEIIGIVNGTTNYILTKMSQEGREFGDVLGEAQRLGYAEADPTADIEGIDAANKLAILGAIAFGTHVPVDEVYREGISQITAKDIDYARRMGYAIKLLAIAKDDNGEIELRVHPALVRAEHPLASVNGVFNGIFVRGDACDDVMLYGRGAGSLPTGSAVAADVIDCARNIIHGATGRVPCACEGVAPLRPIGDVQTRTYVRMRVADRPGVLGRIATIFGGNAVSIESVIQDSTEQTSAEIVWILHRGPERNLRAALAAIAELDIVEQIISVIRVEE